MNAPRILQRPILGGPFGKGGRYALASLSCVARGLHSVRYVVVEPAAGTVLSVSDEKTEALAAARRVIGAAQELARCQAEAEHEETRQGRLFPDEMPVREAAPLGTRRPVSRRRRDVFEKSEGRCCYCSTPLTLDGRWHVEHQMPRALGGGDAIGNLVAACAPCNLSKGDRTAIEFVTESS